MPAKEIPKQYSLDKESFTIIKVLLSTNSSSFYMYKNNTAVNSGPSCSKLGPALSMLDKLLPKGRVGK